MCRILIVLVLLRRRLPSRLIKQILLIRVLIVVTLALKHLHMLKKLHVLLILYVYACVSCAAYYTGHIYISNGQLYV